MHVMDITWKFELGNYDPATCGGVSPLLESKVLGFWETSGLKLMSVLEVLMIEASPDMGADAV